MTVLVTIYVLGVVIGLLFADAGPLARVGLALLWPVAFAAFAATVVMLILAALVALPFQRRTSHG